MFNRVFQVQRNGKVEIETAAGLLFSEEEKGTGEGGGGGGVWTPDHRREKCNGHRIAAKNVNSETASPHTYF